MARILPSFLVATTLFSTPLASAQEASFDRDGVELHYTSTGTGTPVVLLSGGPGLDIEYMLDVAQFLPSGYRSIAFEQRGTGRSRPPEFELAKVTMSTVVEDLEALRVQLKVERLSFLGHSWGGMLAMAYAAAHPERVDLLILVGSGGPTLEFARWFGDNIEARLRTEDIEMRDYWEAAAGKGVAPEKVAIEGLRSILPGYFFDRKVALEYSSAFKEGQYHTDVNERLLGEMSRSYDLREGLRSLKRPVLIVQGHQDPIGDKTAEDIHASISGSTLVYLHRCGHFAWIEQPDAFRKALADFLSSAPH